MSRFSTSTLIRLLLTMTLCIAVPIYAHAGSATIPFMTGSFPGENTFALFPAIYSPDGQWAFDIFTTVVQGPRTGSLECGGGVCQFDGFAPITGGTAGGDLYRWNGSSFDLFATLNGWVNGGGGEDITELYDFSGTLLQFNYQYHYSFVGVWSNQWHTSGNIYGFNMWDGNGSPGPGGSWFDITTHTPEPSTMMLFGSGLLALAKLKRSRRTP